MLARNGNMVVFVHTLSTGIFERRLCSRSASAPSIASTEGPDRRLLPPSSLSGLQHGKERSVSDIAGVAIYAVEARTFFFSDLYRLP